MASLVNRNRLFVLAVLDRLKQFVEVRHGHQLLENRAWDACRALPGAMLQPLRGVYLFGSGWSSPVCVVYNTACLGTTRPRGFYSA